jgi:pantoate--beta-alanine ligase
MNVVTTIAELRRERARLKGRVGLVPTMGALHAGHMSLVEAAVRQCDSVMTSIFVNPTQFGEGEDFNEYPRDMERDTQLLEEAGVSLIFAPEPGTMYPPRFQTYVKVEEVTKGKEGGQRPGHFRGVTTVVAKLFNLMQPDTAFFGQKDAQQVVVIRQMVRDLGFPLDIVVCPIVREGDGLALSSRNVYLQGAQRDAASLLNTALRSAADLYDQGERDPQRLRQEVRDIIQSEPLAHLDYVSLADARTLDEINHATDTPVLLSLAAQVGKPRLLDNMLLPADLNTCKGATRVLGAHDDILADNS